MRPPIAHVNAGALNTDERSHTLALQTKSEL